MLNSSGSVVLLGNDATHATGSFRIQVDYSVYDGASAADPLGVTSQAQIAFKLTHLGGDGETPILKVGRFTVFGPDSFPLNASDPFYTSAQAVTFAGAGSKAPSTINIDPPMVAPTDPVINRVQFYFKYTLQQSNFASGNVSKLLVVTTPWDRIPATVLLEMNNTNSSPGVDADTYINLVPEPCTLAMFGAGLALVRATRRRNDREITR